MDVKNLLVAAGVEFFLGNGAFTQVRKPWDRSILRLGLADPRVRPADEAVVVRLYGRHIRDKLSRSDFHCGRPQNLDSEQIPL